MKRRNFILSLFAMPVALKAAIKAKPKRKFNWYKDKLPEKAGVPFGFVETIDWNCYYCNYPAKGWKKDFLSHSEPMKRTFHICPECHYTYEVWVQQSFKMKGEIVSINARPLMEHN